jgi:CheY-specific phosphatase CheX
MAEATVNGLGQATTRALDVRFINPFVAGVSDVFTKVLGAWARREAPRLSRDAVPDENLAAFIGLSGPVRGAVTLVLPVRTGLAVVQRMLGTPVTPDSPDLADGLAEVVNMIAGGAKARLAAEATGPIDLGLPSVIRGHQFSVCYPSHTVWLEIPFDTQLGGCQLRITLESMP